MLPLRLLSLIALLAATSLRAESPAEQKILEAMKSPDLSVVHLWAPWCSNCQAELKSGGWLKAVKDNPQVKFYFVSVWNDGVDGHAILQKFQITDQPNVTILADPGPRRRQQNQAIRRDAALMDSYDLDLQRRRSPLRIELRRSQFPSAPAISRRQQIGMVA
jgi:Thiol-disulfide isomerase and thioredoxins